MTNGVSNNYNRVDCTVEKVAKSTTKNSSEAKVKAADNIDLQKTTDNANVTAATKLSENERNRKIKEAMEQANQKARFKKTSCEFAYDDTTHRISITVRDKETDEVLKQIPAEETLEMIANLWEQAGIVVDEKR